MFKNNLKKIIEYGIYLFAFFLPWQTRLILKSGSLNGGYFEYGSVGLYGTDILLVMLLLLFFIFLLKDRILNFKFKILNYWCLLAGLELMAFVSIFFADDKMIAVYKYAWLLLGIGFFVLLQKAEYIKIRLIYCFLLGVFFQSILGVWQFLNQFAFANKWLGMAEHDPAVLGVSTIEFFGKSGFGERWLRAYGGLDHPNMLGGLLAIGVLLIIVLLITNRRNIQYPISNNHLIFNEQIWFLKKFPNFPISEFKILTSYFLLLTSLTAIFFTFSRSAWLACVTGVVILLLGGVMKKDWFFQRELLKIILFSGILIFVLFLSFNELVMVRVKAQSRLEQKSNVERMESYRNGIEIIKKNFFFGVGIGNYTLALAKDFPDQPAYYYQPTHNVFLLVLAEIGIFGFVFFISLLVYILYNATKTKNSFAIALLFALLILMMFDHYFWSLHFGVLFWFFVIYFLLDDFEIIAFTNG